ncbi:MAG: hypothetical protein GX757_13055 [Clostridiales bacterium]|nr:hypothetical protein [Clostridiales bacterium]
MDQYDELIEKCKASEADIAKMAIKQYGSIEKYVQAMTKNFGSEIIEKAEQFDKLKEDLLEDNHPVLSELFQRLVSYLGEEPSSAEVQKIAEEIKNTIKGEYELFYMDDENSYWHTYKQIYLILPEWMMAVDKKYGKGASKFIGEVLKANMEEAQPKLNLLYKKLTSDINKDVSSKEIQRIVEEIVKETAKQNVMSGIELGDNYWEYMADVYISNPAFQNATDKNYGEGAALFIGEAIKYYVEHK